MTEAERLATAVKALRAIGSITVERRDDPMHALIAAQELAEEALIEMGESEPPPPPRGKPKLQVVK